MSLETRLQALVSAIGADIKALQAAGGGSSSPSPRDITLNTSFGSVTWASMPAALTELNGSTRSRTKLDLTGYTQARVTASISTVGNSTAELRIQYSTNGDTQSTWAYLDGASGPGANISVNGGRASAWVNLAAAAKADVWVRVVGINGNGSISPAIGAVVLQVK